VKRRESRHISSESGISLSQPIIALLSQSYICARMASWMNLNRRGFQLVENLLLARHLYVKNFAGFIPVLSTIKDNKLQQRNFFLSYKYQLPELVSIPHLKQF